MRGFVACLEVEYAERINIVRTIAFLFMLLSFSFAASYPYWISDDNNTMYANLTFNATDNSFYVYEGGTTDKTQNIFYFMDEMNFLNTTNFPKNSSGLAFTGGWMVVTNNENPPYTNMYSRNVTAPNTIFMKLRTTGANGCPALGWKWRDPGEAPGTIYYTLYQHETRSPNPDTDYIGNDVYTADQTDRLNATSGDPFYYTIDTYTGNISLVNRRNATYSSPPFYAKTFSPNRPSSLYFSAMGCGAVSIDIDFALIYKYANTTGMSVVYGGKDSGSWTIDGETYTARTQFNITGANLTDYQLSLNKSRFSGRNLVITKETTSSTTLTSGLQSPVSGSTLASTNVNFAWQVNQSDTSNVTVKLYVDNVLTNTYTQKANANYSTAQTLAIGSHSWYVYAQITNNSSNNLTTSTSTFNIAMGVVTCGGVSNQSTLNITVVDAQTNAKITNAVMSLTTTYAAMNTTDTFSATAGNMTLCINPANGSFTITNTISITALGYQSNILTETFTVSAALTNKTYSLLNTSSASQTILKVIQSPNTLVGGALVQVYSYSPGSYNLTTTCTTDAGGQCTIYLLGGTQQYFYNVTVAGAKTSFGPELLSCSTTLICYRTFTVGAGGSVPPAFTGQMTGQCAYSNATSIVTCSGTDTGQTLSSITLQAYKVGNSTLICNTTVASYTGTLTCSIPATCGQYNVLLYGTANGVPYSLSGATVGQSCSAGTFGRNGWLAALILFVVMALIAYYNVAVSMIFGMVGLIVGMVIGIIPFDSNSTAIVVIIIVGGIIAYRSKV